MPETKEKNKNPEEKTERQELTMLNAFNEAYRTIFNNLNPSKTIEERDQMALAVSCTHLVATLITEAQEDYKKVVSSLSQASLPKENKRFKETIISMYNISGSRIIIPKTIIKH